MAHFRLSGTVQLKWYQIKIFEINMYRLNNAINGCIWRCWHTVPQQRSVPSLKEHTESHPEVGSCLPIWLPSVPRKSTGKLLHLPFRCLVPTPQGLGGEGEESDSLLLTVTKWSTLDTDKCWSSAQLSITLHEKCNPFYLFFHTY